MDSTNGDVTVSNTEIKEKVDEQVNEDNHVLEEMQQRDLLKLYVSNLGNYMNQKTFLSFLNENHVEGVKSVKKQRGKTFGFIIFNTLEERDAARQVVTSLVYEGKKLICKDAKAQKKRNSTKREYKDRGDNQKDCQSNEKEMKTEEDLANKTTNDVVAPWWNVPIEEQLKRKETEMRQVLKRCSRRITRKDHAKEKAKPEKKNRIGSVKKPCTEFITTGSCMYGDRCKFLHMTMEEYEEFKKKEEEEAKKVEEVKEGVKKDEEVKEGVKKDEEVKEGVKKDEMIEEEKKEATSEEKKEATSEEKKETTGEDETKMDEDKPEKYVKTEEEGQLCTMLPILTGEENTGYRNKCTFTIGLNKEGIPCVGFRMGNFVNGSVQIGEIDDVIVVSPLMKQVVIAVEQFIRSKSYLTYDMCKHEGFWRTLLLRYSARTNQLCVLVIVGNPYEQSTPKAADGLAKLTEQVRKEIDTVMNELLSTLLPSFPCIASFNYQIFTGLSNPGSDCPMITLHGKSYIEEKLFDLTFHVSPYAFFQVNTPVAEILYKNIGDWLSIHDNTLLLDVCCGTGTIGLCLANRVKHVIGVDIEEAAIEDAKLNAKLNGITNCEFICSPAEKVMSELLRSEETRKYDHIVMIVDPPRSGLHKDIIPACRKCDAITELVYVSCNPTGSFVENTVMLCCEPARHNPGSPFVAMKSQPVDLFPHTEHCELMTLFAHM